MISIKSNIIFSAVPNLVTNYLKSKGLKDKHVDFVGQSIHSALMFAKGSGLAASASVTTHAFCKHILGWKHENATTMGNVAATVISLSKKLTPLGIAHATMVAFSSYAANKIGTVISQKISKKT